VVRNVWDQRARPCQVAWAAAQRRSGGATSSAHCRGAWVETSAQVGAGGAGGTTVLRGGVRMGDYTNYAALVGLPPQLSPSLPSLTR